MKLSVPPSVAEALLIVICRCGSATSSLAIVPTPVPSRIVALPTTFERFTLNVSSGSTTVSPLTCTVTVSEVSPGAKVTVPVAAV